MSLLRALKNLLLSDANTRAKNAFIAAVYLVILTFTAVEGYRALDTLFEGDGISLSSPVSAWVKRWGMADMAAYVKVADNIAKGHGITYYCEPPQCDPARYEQWHFWGFGTPVAFAIPYWIGYQINVPPMVMLFYCIMLVQILMTFVTFKIARLYTQNFAALLLLGILAACYVPLQDHIFYRTQFASSETVIMVPMALFLYLLQVGYNLLWKTPDKTSKAGRYFFAAGIILGFIHLARESMYMFAPFIFGLTILMGLLKRFSKKQLLYVAKCGFLFFIGAWMINWSVKEYNKHRIGMAVIGSGTTSIWYDNLWAPWDGSVDDADDDGRWWVATGIGFPSYLDPEAGKNLRALQPLGEFTTGKAIKEFVRVVLMNPIRAIEFKLKRLPMLLMSFRKVPYWTLDNPIQIWMSLLYLTWAILLILCFVRRIRVPEVMYQYLIFILISHAIIHAEFRYSLPMIYALMLAPPLLAALLLKRYQSTI